MGNESNSKIWVDKIKSAIADGDTERALEELILHYKYQNQLAYDDVIIIQSTYKALCRKKILHTISSELFQVEINKIHENILNIANDSNLTTAKEKYDGRKYKTYFLITVIIVLSLAVFRLILNENKQATYLPSSIQLDQEEVVDKDIRPEPKKTHKPIIPKNVPINSPGDSEKQPTNPIEADVSEPEKKSIDSLQNQNQQQYYVSIVVSDLDLSITVDGHKVSKTFKATLGMHPYYWTFLKKAEESTTFVFTTT